MGKILIVDDEQGIRLLLQEVFKEEGYVVLTAETGKEALSIMKENDIDVIVIDYKLPIMNGVEVLRKLENDGYSTPTILMSGMFEMIQKDIQDLSLVKHTLSKPFDMDELTKQVSSLLS